MIGTALYFFRWVFPKTLTKYYKYPDQLGGVLAKVGGLIALLKFVSLILVEYHRQLFEKEYEEKRRKTMSKAIGDGESLTGDQAGAKFKDIFSFDNLA